MSTRTSSDMIINRSSTRVAAPPGGRSAMDGLFSWGGDSQPQQRQQRQQPVQNSYPSARGSSQYGGSIQNQYSSDSYSSRQAPPSSYESSNATSNYPSARRGYDAPPSTYGSAPSTNAYGGEPANMSGKGGYGSSFASGNEDDLMKLELQLTENDREQAQVQSQIHSLQDKLGTLARDREDLQNLIDRKRQSSGAPSSGGYNGAPTSYGSSAMPSSYGGSSSYASQPSSYGAPSYGSDPMSPKASSNYDKLMRHASTPQRNTYEPPSHQYSTPSRDNVGRGEYFHGRNTNVRVSNKPGGESSIVVGTSRDQKASCYQKSPGVKTGVKVTHYPGGQSQIRFG
eukprot:TRINITY_DN773111_c0_g1_i1.p1 TRINITY_DN773111_c0_g1~~TRINITY_DN773111_c0_g1_i1.p1  ORF type:complete len:341 (+),score=99.28 TRINITY_DN773111_c0_g1_i1:170-1192(+)